MRAEGFLGTDASFLVDLELLLGLAVMTVMVIGMRLGQQGKREEHVRWMKRLGALIGIFLLVFLANVIAGGDVEAVHEGARNKTFLAMLALHVLAALVAGIAFLRAMWSGIQLARQEKPAAGQIAAHGSRGTFWTGFWLMNGLLGILIYLVAYVF